MILINFSHPLTPAQVERVRELTGGEAVEVREVPVQVDAQAPLAPQVAALVDAAGLSPEEWQTLPLVVNPPGYAPAAVALVAELHGRMGHFPAMMRLRPVEASVPTRYEVAELLDLQGIRGVARGRRQA